MLAGMPYVIAFNALILAPVALLCIFGAGVVITEFVQLMLVFPQSGALAVVLELPLVLIGFAFIVLATIGFVFEYYRGLFSH